MAKDSNRIVTDEDIRKYEPVIEMFIRTKVIKNWREASLAKNNDEITLGNSGWTIADFRQYLRMQVFIALKNYDSSKNTKESTFIFTHLSNRIGQTLKKLVLESSGYGAWTSQLETVMKELDSDFEG